MATIPTVGLVKEFAEQNEWDFHDALFFLTQDPLTDSARLWLERENPDDDLLAIEDRMSPGATTRLDGGDS